MRKQTTWTKRAGAIVLSAALVVGMLPFTSIEAQAAPKVSRIRVTASNKVLGSSKTIYVGGPSTVKTTKLSVTVTPKNASKKVKYISSDKKVATVSSKGKVTAKKKGKATITVTSKSNKKVSKKVKITVKKYVYPTKITATAGKTIYAGSGTGTTTKISTSIAPSNTSVKKVTYKSSSPSLATVSDKGVVTANKAGKTGTVKITVTAVSKTKKKKTLKQTVSIQVVKRPQVSSVSFSSSARTLTKTGTTANPITILKATVLPATAENLTLTWSSSNTDVATVDRTGKVTAKNMGTAVITATAVNGKKATCKITVKKNTVSVHDPSIVLGTDNNYYIFGSHMAWAKTSSLTGWTTFRNNINKNSGNNDSIFAPYWNNWAKYNNQGVANKLNPSDGKSETTALNGNEWAPDVIYNKKMKKWCMYMSINGPDYNSVIVLCTADSLEGDWQVSGPVVYSGFTNNGNDVTKHGYELTDYKKATGDTSLASRYGGATYNPYYGVNAIDPCVKYDKDGNLWMVYGSWYGGIYMLKLDEKTGLRDYTNTYSYNADDSTGVTTDPYFGIRIAGGSRASGEGAYMIEKDGYYYLFLSYGGLVANGGYNMRVFRSENITGPYKDKAGNSALRTNTNGAGNTTGNIGIRLMAGYKWSCNAKGYLAQGHNSALVDKDGSMYLIYHTRQENSEEGHFVETHQMWMSEDGWLCVAPYEYNGEKISQTGYSKSEIIGTYEYLVQNPAQKNGTCATSTYITLGEDGSIGGLDAAGSWEIKDGKAYATFTIQGVVYQGVFAYGYDESDNRNKVMTFTAVGDNNVCIWGSKTITPVKTAKEAQKSDAEALTLASQAAEDFYLPTYGAYGSKITWKADNVTVDEDSSIPVVTVEGRKAKINRRLIDTSTKLTATITNGSNQSKKEFTVTIPKYDVSVADSLDTNKISLPKKLGQQDEVTVEWTSDNAAIDTNGNVQTVINDTVVHLTARLTLEGKTVTKEFTVTVEGIVIPVSTVIKSDMIELPGEVEGFAITWESSDSSIIDTANGTVTRPAMEKQEVTLTAKIGPDAVEREFVVTVIPKEFNDYIYHQDYETANAADVFASQSLDGGIRIASEGNNKYLQFAQDGSSGNRGGYGSFGTAVNTLEDYVVELDLKIRSGNVANRSQSQFVLADTGTSGLEKNNNGVTGNYILKLSTGPSSTTWTINDDATKTVEIPSDDWVHIEASVSTLTKTVNLKITQGETVLYMGKATVAGDGYLQGMYILSGRGNGLTMVDNIKVY